MLSLLSTLSLTLSRYHAITVSKASTLCAITLSRSHCLTVSLTPFLKGIDPHRSIVIAQQKSIFPRSQFYKLNIPAIINRIGRHVYYAGLQSKIYLLLINQRHRISHHVIAVSTL